MFDVAHGFWSFIVTFTSLLVMLMFCVWRWKDTEVISVLQRLNLPTIEDQAQTYMDDINPGRSVKKKFQIRTNGIMNIRICSRFHFALQQAAFISAEHENRNSNTTYGCTLVLVVFWIVVSDMKYVWWVLWKSKFDVNSNNDRPSEIENMLHKGCRAIYIAHHLCSILVCIYPCVIVQYDC